jgi:hypothetical membrane protein
MRQVQKWQIGGALSFMLGGLLYLLAEKVAALGWSQPTYSYINNYISDLGVTDCGVMPDGRDICSPLHGAMNIGFALEGILFFIACWLLRPLFSGLSGRLVVLFGLLHGAGGLLIALFHSEPTDTLFWGVSLHQFGAFLAIVGGNLTLLCAGWSQWNKASWLIFSRLSWLLGLFGLLSLVVLTRDILPTGVAERGSVYSITLWQIFTGIYLLVARGNRRQAA